MPLEILTVHGAISWNSKPEVPPTVGFRLASVWRFLLSFCFPFFLGSRVPKKNRKGPHGVPGFEALWSSRPWGRRGAILLSSASPRREMAIVGSISGLVWFLLGGRDTSTEILTKWICGGSIFLKGLGPPEQSSSTHAVSMDITPYMSTKRFEHNIGSGAFLRRKPHFPEPSSLTHTIGHQFPPHCAPGRWAVITSRVSCIPTVDPSTPRVLSRVSLKWELDPQVFSSPFRHRVDLRMC